MKNMLVLGDSHSTIFRYCNGKTQKFNFNVLDIGGATAQGAVNPNSKTDALKIFTRKLETINTKNIDYIMIMLGEVDCGFVIWVRSKRYNINVDEQIDISVDNLFSFIENIVRKYFKSYQIIIVGSVLPIIKDSTDKRFINGARAEVDASQEIITKKTIEYNLKLKNKAKVLGFHYIDITNLTMNTETNLIDDIYLSSIPHDHHLNKQKSYKLWLNILDCYFYR
ncbi:hypothetical protein LCGC14_2359780 [marine sediment metagenome]|uniref:SGNH hydrolase-type esterase domain-containing protein n=2 Tax=root TaxID=1 RepID=A0A0F9C763_9ZZZZ|nr:MAG: hypothetical protein LCMAC202_06070 [Marseillevirus LCMAC202]